jgi:hypothetical protein
MAGEIRPLSMTPDGRLRATIVQAHTTLDFFGDEADNMLINSECARARLENHKYSGPNPWGI